MSTNYDLSQLDLSVGQHIIKVKAKASGYRDSNFSSTITYNVYSITPTLTNVTASQGNVSKLGQGCSTTLTFTASSGYSLPDVVSVVGATSSWNKVLGTLTLSNPTANVTFSISGLMAYSITATLTNCTAQAGNPTTIEQGGTAQLTYLFDGTNYKCPTIAPTVTGATATWVKVSDTKGNLTLSNPTGNVAFSVVGEAIASYPVKGQLITMNLGNGTPAAGTNNQYRVLSINGSVAEVVAMYDMSTSQTFGADNTYSGSNLDTYLNSTFYGTLSSTAKAAIVDKTFTQDSWYWGTPGSPSYNGTYLSGSTQYGYQVSLGSNAYRTAITRHVYALSVQDVIDYLGVTTSMTSANTTLTAPNIWQMFWNTTAKPSTVTYPWLRSAGADYSRDAWYVRGNYGFVNRGGVDGSDAARPALTIDLSKISWS